MNRLRPPLVLLLVSLGAGLIVVGMLSRQYWFFWLDRPDSSQESISGPATAETKPVKILLSDETIESLKLKAKSMFPQISWKAIQISGMVVDKPGFSDRGIVAPVTSAVVKIHRFSGDVVKPGDSLFTLRLHSETMHLTQTELFKATQETDFTEEKYRRFAALSETGTMSRGDVIELDNQRKRLKIAVQAYRQELQNRGLTPEQIDKVAQGKFASEIEVVVPVVTSQKDSSPFLEVQEVKIELGQQVQAGQTLCLLANHQSLYIEGRAFRDETPLLEHSVEEGWPIEVDFQEDPPARWPALDQIFYIRRLSNTIDPTNRTFAFQLPLENQSRLVEHKGIKQILWRFRPGQKVRLMVRVAKFENMFELPADAVARDVTESYVFTQNVNTFERVPVRVVYQTRRVAIIANDGSLVPGTYVVQSGAAQLNRIAKTQSHSVPKGYHVHADGSLHKNEDEGK